LDKVNDDPQEELLICQLAKAELADLGRSAQTGSRGAARIYRTRSAMAVVTPDIPMPLFNRIVGLGIGMPATKQEIAELVCLYPVWCPLLVEILPCARPPELAGWLEDHDLRLLKSCAVSRLGACFTPGRPTNIEVRRVRPGEAALFGQITASASGWPDTAAPLVAIAAEVSSSRCYLAWCGNEAVAAASMVVVGRAAKLARAATLPRQRRTGAHRALIDKRVNDARFEGCRVILTENHDSDPASSNPSFRNLQRAGFQIVAWRQNYGRNATSCTA
jgi:hypothetical protein